MSYEKAPIVSSSLPMDVIVSEVEKPVVHPGGLTEIPSLYTVTKAISILCKQTEVSMKKYVYIQLSFGLIDYKGLKELQLHHNSLKQINIKETILNWITEVGNVYGLN